ncbi:T9SS type A sorting domain-containing protein [Dinghuibacter silviterrae]|uniref:Putative secreted protein (Por secretion system target) n=1 Tax=Dinghuibacter silviterrae TaxID=1539049 RepID=A0A4V3GKZ7_9BACT|nr:T9SS type A sorting domain-containing protein [Dinghuibacter silviterrae]TDW97582.1 putative secreted protein (Por secretion system target) [Dinghuibacter silviterrae]
MRIIFLLGLVAPLGLSAQNFFLNGWQARSWTAPTYVQATKPTGSVTATVRIDPTKALGQVSPYLFGNNTNPYIGQMVTEPTLIQYLTDLSPHLIRAPGGSISDVYFWNATTAPADAPDSLYNTNGNPIAAGYWFGNNTASWTLSLANYYKMLQMTGAKGIITVNYAYARYGTGPNPVATAAHLAADWVRADSGRTQFWEIGNESGGPWEASYKINTATNQDGQPQIISGALYGQHVKVFADSMRAAASEIGATIYIGAQLLGTDASSHTWNPPDITWNSGYFSSAGETADFYIVHDYYATSGSATNVDSILNIATGETNAVSSYMAVTTAQGGVTEKPVALTEWNISNTGSDQEVSFIAALHATLVLGELTQHPVFGEASRWDIANGWSNGDDQGMFNAGDEPGGAPKWNPRPAFFNMYYFQRCFGDRVIGDTVTGSTSVKAYASSFSSGETGVVLVNKGASSELVQIEENGVGATYHWYTLTGGTDNGNFSRQVFVNGNGPTGISGGPLNYATLSMNTDSVSGGVLLSLPPLSATFVVIDKGSLVTAVTNIDPTDRLIKLFPNPAPRGHCHIRVQGFTGADRLTLHAIDLRGRVVYTQTLSGLADQDLFIPAAAGVYKIEITTPSGVTTKTLLID